MAVALRQTCEADILISTTAPQAACKCARSRWHPQLGIVFASKEKRCRLPGAEEAFLLCRSVDRVRSF